MKRQPRDSRPHPGKGGSPWQQTGTPPVFRVAFDRAPLANLIAHGAAAPEVEVGGVLVGYIGEDDNGRFVHVQAVIRAEQAREQGAHVTFTHDTWNHIHREMDTSHRGQEIVGWYHTHPGFGVFLSEMDTFIHENFFNQPHHVALVYDPLSGRMCMNVLQGGRLVRLDKYWCDGREIRLHDDEPGRAAGPAPEATALADVIRRLERVPAVPQRRSWVEEWLTPILLLSILALAVHGWLSNRELALKAAMLDRLLLLADEGQIRILDPYGNELLINGIEPRLERSPRPQGRQARPPAPPAQRPSGEQKGPP